MHNNSSSSINMNSKSKKRPYKWCIVPLCVNTTIITPTKVFVNVPLNSQRRKSWIKAVRRDDLNQLSKSKSALFCCEDHFNMEEDMENFMRVKMMGGNLISKKNVVPHIFECQPQRCRLTKHITPRAGVMKRNARQLVSDALNPIIVTSVENEEIEMLAHKLPDDMLEQQEATQLISEVEGLKEQTPLAVKHVGVQAKCHYRSKGTSCTPMQLGILSSTLTSPIKPRPALCDAQLSPMKLPGEKQRWHVDDIFTDSSSEGEEYNAQFEICSQTKPKTHSNEDSYIPSNSDEEANSSEEKYGNILEEQMKAASLQRVRFNCKKYPMRYLGVPDDSLFVIDLLVKLLDYRAVWLEGYDVVMLVLRKIRLNESFSILADEFGISTSHASRLFSKYTPIISSYMEELIVWPEAESIRRMLPIPFRARYSKVQSVIDCFEVEIEKPTNAVHQALTWSDYKKCNTVKYLVSATPDGVVNFVSKGYGGRVSDMVLLQDSGYLEKLSEGMHIMADRGFKHVESELWLKKCTLVRPPSVSDGGKLNATDCKQTKRIASLRIHIERLISRFREFKFLVPHACVDTHLLDKVDYCVKITAGLINLQDSHIK